MSEKATSPPVTVLKKGVLPPPPGNNLLPYALSPALFNLAPPPPFPRARRGGGPPSAQVTGHVQPPMIRNTLTSRFRFYHP